jgi:hypothetical protein
MLRRRYRFVYGIDSEYGKRGLQFKDSGFDYGSKEQISHDILEHLKRNRSLEDEYRAFGAIIWLRGEPGYFPDWKSHISASIVDMWRYVYDRHKILPSISPRRIGGIDADLDSLMNRAIEVARKAFVRDADDAGMFIAFKKDLPLIRNLIRSGYRKARQRYGHIGQRKMKNLSKKISSVAEEAVQACEFEGQEVDIIIDWKSLTARFQVLP